MKKINVVLSLMLMAWIAQVTATSSVPSLNQCPDMIFIDGIEDNSVPSNGTGGVYPGASTQSVFVNVSLGTHTYYIFVPSTYSPTEAMPMMTVWHGAAGAGNSAVAAEGMRDDWQSTAELYQFIVVAQVSTGASGGWIPGNDVPILTAIIADMESRYNIETTRHYVWGFSAGGFVMHAIALANADYFAAYAISGANLGFANSANYTPANAVRHIPAFISVGQSDSYFSSAQADIQTFELAGWEQDKNLWFDGFNGGHTVPIDLPSKAWNKICISTSLD